MQQGRSNTSLSERCPKARRDYPRGGGSERYSPGACSSHLLCSSDWAVGWGGRNAADAWRRPLLSRWLSKGYAAGPVRSSRPAPRTRYVSARGHAPVRPRPHPAPTRAPALPAEGAERRRSCNFAWRFWAYLGLSPEPSRGRRRAAASPVRASAQRARPWQPPPPAPRRIWPLRSPPVAEQPLTTPPARPPAPVAAAPGSAQVSAAEEAGGEGGGGRTRGVVRPRPSRPLCGGASWPRRPAAGTAPAEPAVSRRVSNGTVPGWRGGCGRPRRLGTPVPLPSLLRPGFPPAASPTPPRSRPPGFLPAADTPAPPADIWRAASPAPSAPHRAARLQPAPPRAAAPAPQLKARLGLLGLCFVVRPLPFPSWVVWSTRVTGLAGDLSEKVAATVMRRRPVARLGGPGSAAPTAAASTWGVLGREEVAGDAVSSVSDPGGDFCPSVKPGHLPAALSGIRGGHVLLELVDLWAVGVLMRLLLAGPFKKIWEIAAFRVWRERFVSDSHFMPASA